MLFTCSYSRAGCTPEITIPQWGNKDRRWANQANLWHILFFDSWWLITFCCLLLFRGNKLMVSHQVVAARCCHALQVIEPPAWNVSDTWATLAPTLLSLTLFLNWIGQMQTLNRWSSQQPGFFGGLKKCYGWSEMKSFTFWAYNCNGWISWLAVLTLLTQDPWNQL